MQQARGLGLRMRDLSTTPPPFRPERCAPHAVAIDAMLRCSTVQCGRTGSANAVYATPCGMAHGRAQHALLSAPARQPNTLISRTSLAFMSGWRQESNRVASFHAACCARWAWSIGFKGKMSKAGREDQGVKGCRSSRRTLGLRSQSFRPIVNCLQGARGGRAGKGVGIGDGHRRLPRSSGTSKKSLPSLGTAAALIPVINKPHPSI